LIFSSGSQSGQNRPLGGDFPGQGSDKTNWGDRGQVKQHKGKESSKPLIDH